jgi:signal transduction histidine kinase
VEIRLQYLTRNSPDNNSIILEVEDTGIGIAPEEQEFLFERFRQGNHQRLGNGLGLYLCRQIVETHQATISVQSEIGAKVAKLHPGAMQCLKHLLQKDFRKFLQFC